MRVLRFSVILFCLPWPGHGALVNTTVDDSDSESGTTIDYNPLGAWNDGPTCGTCAAHPNGSHAYDGTWHDGTYFPDQNPQPLTATISFYGVAVYVYCIIPEANLGDSGSSVFNFIVDSHLDGNFTTPSSENYQYNYLVYSNTHLPQTNHTLVIQNGVRGGTRSIMLLDYIVYSYDDDSGPSTHSIGESRAYSGQKTVKILGGVLGTLAGLLLILLGILIYRRDRDSTSRPTDKAPFFWPAPFWHWLRHPFSFAFKDSDTASRFSFHPSLFVVTRANRSRSTSPLPTAQPRQQWPMRGGSFASARTLPTEPGAPFPPPDSVAPPKPAVLRWRDNDSLKRRMWTILEWRKQTLEAMQGSSENARSEHLPASPSRSGTRTGAGTDTGTGITATTTRQQTTELPPLRPPQRLFTVVNR